MGRGSGRCLDYYEGEGCRIGRESEDRETRWDQVLARTVIFGMGGRSSKYDATVNPSRRIAFFSSSIISSIFMLVGGRQK